MEKTIKVLVANLVVNEILILVFDLNTHMFYNRVHVVFAYELGTDFKARTMIKCAVKIMWTHNFIVIVDVAAFRYMLVHVLYHDRIRWTNFKLINLSTFSQENRDGIFITNFNSWFHCDALSIPERI